MQARGRKTNRPSWNLRKHKRLSTESSRDPPARQVLAFPLSLKPSIGADIVEVAEVIVDSEEIEHPLEAFQCDAHPVGAAEAAELAAAFDVGFKIENDAGNAAAAQASF